jgi:dynactin complex subunit
MFVGKVKGLGHGQWIGIKLDEPTGDSNGVVKDVKIFEVAEKHGIFMRSTAV